MNRTPVMRASAFDATQRRWSTSRISEASAGPRVADERATSFFHAVLQGRPALGALTLAYVVAGLLLVAAGRVLYDEGLLTYVFARWLVIDPVPVLFFQKTKPITAALLAVPALGGLNVLLAVHVVLAAAAAPLIAEVARAMGIRAPNLAALIVLVSPLYLLGAAAGTSSVDGVVGTSLFLYLAIVRRRDWLAGMVLGCLPWVRYELAPFAIIMWLCIAIAERRRGLVLGAFAFPVVYAVSGAAYHRDLLWFLHFGPTMPTVMPGNPMWEGDTIGLSYLLPTQLLVTAAVGFAFAVDWRRLSRTERVLVLSVVVSTVLLNVLPALRVWNFGGSPRYSLQTLPVFALLAARAVDPLVEGRSTPRRLFLLPVLLVAIWLVSNGPSAVETVPVLLGYLGAAAFAAVEWKRAAATAIAVTACLGLGIGGTQMTTPAYVSATMTWLEQHAAEIRGATLYTNSPLLPFRIAASDALAHTDVRFVIGPDIRWELDGLSDADNRQREALLGLARTELFGRAIFAAELAPDAVPPRSLFVLADDPRLTAMLPERVWASRLQRIGSIDSVTIARLVPSGAPRS